MEPAPIFNPERSDDQDLANDDQRSQKKPTFFTCFAETRRLPQNDVLVSTLVPMVRKVVAEVLDLKLVENFNSTATLTRLSPVSQIQAHQTPSYKLVFSKNLSLPMYTGNKIVDRDNNPLQILLVDPTGDQMTPVPLHPPTKVELVILNGDFPSRGYEDSWTSQQFNNNVVKKRHGKPPLLHGDILVTLKHGVATIGDMEFTDNSSWIPSRMFKIGARVAACGGTNGFQGCILEAMTEPFIVKEYRMGLCKKHYPPMLVDEVWRLEKISKDGVFHRKLASEGISTVKDFLNLCATAAAQKRLRGILGTGMSNKMWEVVLKHAKTCKIDNNTSCEQSSVDKLQQGIVTEKYAPLAQGAMVDQSYFSHVQANEHLENVDAGGYMSFVAALGHEILASTSQLEGFNLDFEVDN